MKPSAYIINIGRGGTIDEAELIAALQNGEIAGAGLDVTVPEPWPKESPLWAMEDVIITAHYAGERVKALFLDNLRRYAAGKPLRNLVNVDLPATQNPCESTQSHGRKR